MRDPRTPTPCLQSPIHNPQPPPVASTDRRLQHRWSPRSRTCTSLTTPQRTQPDDLAARRRPSIADASSRVTKHRGRHHDMSSGGAQLAAKSGPVTSPTCDVSGTTDDCQVAACGLTRATSSARADSDPEPADTIGTQYRRTSRRPDDDQFLASRPAEAATPTLRRNRRPQPPLRRLQPSPTPCLADPRASWALSAHTIA